MQPKILEEHDDELIVKIGNKVKSIPNNPYTVLKKMHFDDNRIIYKFTDFVVASETYNDRIFNLTYDKYTITTRQELSDSVAKTILDHYKKGDYTKFKDLFLNIYSAEHRDELVEKFILSLSPLIRIEKKNFPVFQREAKLPVYIVADNFAIDSNQISYYKSEKDNQWNFLCTVVTSQSYQTYRVPMGNLGWAKLETQDNGIISKIVFFLNPNPNDNVFVSQLSQNSPHLHQSLLDGTYLKEKT